MTRKTAAPSLTLSVVSLIIAASLAPPIVAAQPQLLSDSKSGAATPSSEGFTFQKAKTFDSGGQLAWSVVASDVNGDGKPDLLVLNNNGEPVSGDGSVGVLLNNGSGSFRRVVTYDAGGLYATGIAVGDVNADGKPDLVVAIQVCPGTSTNCLGVLLGNGDGTFKPAVLYPDGGIEWASGGGILIPVIIADVNGDSKPDLIVISQSVPGYGDGQVGVLLGNGDGTFKPVVTYSTGGFGAFAGQLADVNGDGKPDIVVLNCSPHGSADCSRDGLVGVLLGNGNGTFQTAATYDTGGTGGTAALAIADVNGDGRPDILVGNDCPGHCTGDGSFSVLLGKADGTLQPAVAYDIGDKVNTGSIAVGDLNADGKPDVAITAGSLSVWLNKGDGTFQLSKNYSGGTGQVFLSDLDGDGKLDLVDVNSTSNTADARAGNGDGTFQSSLTFSLGGKQFSWATLADINGDGRPDLLSANWCSVSCGSEEGAAGVLLNVALTPSPTSTALTSSLNPSSYGQKLTFTATVTNSGGAPPTGKVSLFSSGAAMGTVTLNSSGVATFIKSKLNAATYSLTAVYKGDTNNLGSTSAVLSQVVQPATTTATLKSSPNPSTVGQAVTFTATITSPTVTPTGSVTFTAGNTTLGTATLSGGKAILTTSSLSSGSITVTATYEGDSNIQGSSASITQVVQP